MAKIWTSEHEEFIREHYRHKTYAELADHFGVTQKAMESKIRRMGLKKQDYKEADVVPTILPLQPAEPESPPAMNVGFLLPTTIWSVKVTVKAVPPAHSSL